MNRSDAIWLLFIVVIVGTAISSIRLTLLAVILMLFYISIKKHKARKARANKKSVSKKGKKTSKKRGRKK